MLNKFLLIFLFACTQTIERTAIQGIQSLEKDQYVVYDRPDFPDDYHQIEYVGDWKHMSHGGSYNINELSKLDTARFEFWGYGVQVRTELMSHHKAYQVIIDGKFIENINVKNDVNTLHNLTYSNMELSTGNHVIELVPDGGYFVLNSLTIHYYVDPTPNECDTVYVHDTIFVNTIDTVFIEKVNWIDSIRWEVKDSIIWHEKDTLIIQYKDSTIIHHDTLESRIDTFYILPKKITFELN